MSSPLLDIPMYHCISLAPCRRCPAYVDPLVLLCCLPPLQTHLLSPLLSAADNKIKQIDEHVKHTLNPRQLAVTPTQSHSPATLRRPQQLSPRQEWADRCHSFVRVRHHAASHHAATTSLCSTRIDTIVRPLAVCRSTEVWGRSDGRHYAT